MIILITIIILLPYTAVAMAIFPTYLTTSFIDKFCSPSVNRYSPLPSPAQQEGLGFKWMKKNKICVYTPVCAIISPLSSSSSSGFFPSKRSATTHDSHRKEREREGC